MKKFKASILAVTLIILGIMLITALSVSIVSIKERKASMGEVKSGQALQNAQSGVELVLKAITKGSLSAVSGIASHVGATCSGGKITGAQGYSVILQDKDGNAINCDSSKPISDIVSIKSVGTGSGQQRAIEAAVPAPVVP